MSLKTLVFLFNQERRFVSSLCYSYVILLCKTILDPAFSEEMRGYIVLDFP